jgi:hypothetical protein
MLSVEAEDLGRSWKGLHGFWSSPASVKPSFYRKAKHIINEYELSI